MNPLDQIDSELLARRIFHSNTGWISAVVLADLLGTSERKLRGEDSPIRSHAISSNEGYKGILNASDEEFRVYVERIRSHAISELRRLQHLKRRRIAENVQEFSCIPIH